MRSTDHGRGKLKRFTDLAGDGCIPMKGYQGVLMRKFSKSGG